MPRSWIVIGLVSTLILVVSSWAPAEDAFKSGPQPGANLPSAFDPYNVTGEFAGEKHCLVCENGLNPVVMIFARDLSEPLMQLIVKIDAATAKHRAQEMGSFVVFLSDQPGLERQLQKASLKHKLKHTVLSIDEPAGPEDYKISKDADITVVLYSKHIVKANHAFKKGELKGQGLDQIVADLPKILPSK